MSDINEYLDNSTGIDVNDLLIAYILFADDLILCSETPEGLQTLLNQLQIFCSKWHLILSPTKSKIMVFNKRKVAKNVVFTFNNSVLEIVFEYKYLGVIFSSNTNDCFKKNGEHLASKARKATFALNSYIKNSVGYLNPRQSLHMFDKQIVPILDYACDVTYGSTSNYELEKVHLNYLKYLLCVKPCTSSKAVYAELGRFTLETKHKIQVLKYWQRLLNMPDGTPIKHAYNELFSLQSSRHRNWCSFVKQILIDVDMEDIWLNQDISDKNIRAIKCLLHENFIRDTLTGIEDSEKSPKLRSYKLFKTDFRLENYLSCIRNRSHQIALSKFRVSSHNLRIETGRYDRNPKLEPHERLCIYCTSNCVEDENHFILGCPLYKNQRRLLFNICKRNIDNFDSLNDENRFIKIMSSKNEIIIRNLGKYVYNCFNIRSKYSR